MVLSIADGHRRLDFPDEFYFFFIQVCDKEKLLENLVKDTADRKRVGPAVSKRIYRLLMAKDGNLSTKEVDEGADHFT